MAQEWQSSAKPDGPTDTLEAELSQTKAVRGSIVGCSSCETRGRGAFPAEGTWPGSGPAPTQRLSEREDEMLRADLLKADLLSEIVLLGSSVVILILVLLIVTTALTHA